MASSKLILVMALVWLGSTTTGSPVDSAEPAAAAAPTTTVEQSPTVAVAPAPAPQQVTTPEKQPGTGVITEHKNPDGSTITITHFNGPLPANAFPSFGGGAGGFPSPFFYPWGYPAPGGYPQGRSP